MKFFYLILLVFVVGGGGLFYQSGLRAAKHPNPPERPLAARVVKGIPLGGGTVLINHFYPLIPPRRVQVRYIYVIAGQHVSKGEVLAKFEDHTYVVARAAGIITQPTDPAVAITDAFPRLWLTETAPFRLRLPITAASVSLCPGQQVRVTSRAHPTQLVTGKVGKVLIDKAFMLIDLRLQTVSPQSLPVGAQVLVEALPPQVG